MALNDLEFSRIQKEVEAYVQSRRPPANARHQLDVAFRISGQSVEIFEVRPAWRETDVTVEIPIAKASFVRARGLWKIYWQRADLKWHRYDPHPEAKSIREFLDVIEADEHSCFYG